MKKKIFVNLKDWLNLEENIEFASKIKEMDITVFPSLPYLYIYKDSGVKVGSQKISSFDPGAHTGSISAKHLKDFGVSAVILNHRECQIDEVSKIVAKVKNAQESEIEVILCISSSSNAELSKISAVLEETDDKCLWIAYEPMNQLPIEDIKKDFEIIRENFKQYNLSYIYGNNVTSENISSYIEELPVNGFLISSHALDAEELKYIVNCVK